MLFTPRTCLWCLPVCCPSCGLHTTTICFISPQLVYAAIKNYFSPLSLLITKQPTLQPRLWRPPGCQQQCYQSHLRGAQQRSDYRGSFGSDCSDPLRPCRSFPKTHSVKRGFQWYSEDYVWYVKMPKTIMSDVLHLFIKNVLPGAFFVNLLSSSLSLWLWLTPFLSQWQVFPKNFNSWTRLIWPAYISTSLGMVKATLDLHLMNTILDDIGHLMNVEAVLARSQSADLSREHQLAVWLLYGDAIWSLSSQCTMRLPMSIDIFEVLKCKHSFHAHFK